MDTFLREVSDRVARGTTHMEAVLMWCQDRGLEPEYAGSLVKKNRTLRAKIQAEAETLNCIKRTARLPI